jgi:tRNA threonylcarbamoyladenosine biosynthesis protein TsaB
MTIILAIDCATGPCSVAVWKNGRVTTCLENPKPSAQSAVLMPMIEDALKRNSINYRDISCVAATVGPGSFTGIRVGLAAARGIAFAADIKSLGFTTLEVMAFAAGITPVLAMLNAGKGEFYYQLFEARKDAPHLGTREQALAYAEGALITEQTPSAAALAELAATQESAAQSLTPFYIRPPDAKLPTKKI